MADSAKRERGRPVGSVAEQTREKPIQIKAYPEEKEAYQAAAKREGLTMSAWIRQQLNKAARGD